MYKKGDTVSLLSMDRKERGKAKVKSVTKAKPNKQGIKNFYVTNKGTFSDMEVVGTKAFKLRFKEDKMKSFKEQEFVTEDYIQFFRDAFPFLTEKKIAGLVKKAEKSGLPYGILKQVYNRGMAAWRTGHRPGTSPQQWAFARVNSFVTKSKGTWGGADKDLAAKVRKSESTKKESLWANIHKKRERIKRGSGERMRKKGEKGAPTAAQMKRAKSESVTEVKMPPMQYAIYDKKTKEVYAASSKPFDKFKMDDVADDMKVKKSNLVMKKMRKGQEVGERLKEQTSCEALYDHVITEAEYKGKKVKLNDPIRSSDGKKKFHVYVKNEKGNVIKLGFGDPNMEIKRDDPKRRKNFRARHNCDNPGPKWKARYWSCYQWRGGAKVDN